MSWISGLADKAENILNKIDQNAAVALQVPANNLDIIYGETTPVYKPIPHSTALKLVSPKKTTTYIDTHSSIDKSLESRGDVRVNANSIGNNSESFHSEVVAIDIHIDNPSKPYNTEFEIQRNDISDQRNDLKEDLHVSQEILVSDFQAKLRDTETCLQDSLNQQEILQKELIEAQTVLKNYVHSKSELEFSLSKLKQEYFDLSQKFDMQIKETEQQRLELQEYRKKAQLALQIKDNLISELKRDGNSISESSHSSTDIRILKIELDHLKEERKNMLEEHHNLACQLAKAKENLKSVSLQHDEDISKMQIGCENLRKELRMQNERNMQLESEFRVLTQEMNTLKQQYSNHMAASSTRLQDKERLIERLKTQVDGSGASTSSSSQTESRVKVLTQALVDKQNAIENVTADRNALRLQLEKVQDQLQALTYNINNNGNQRLPSDNHCNSTDDVKAQFPLLMREHPFDNRVARRVKRAYSSLDSAGIRVGIFLRRYPLIRISVFIYVALLHIWVIFVLFSSTPS